MQMIMIDKAVVEQALAALVRSEVMHGQPNFDIQDKLREAMAQPQPVQAQGPMAATVEEATRDVAKCLNERDGHGLDLRHVAMLVHYAQLPVQKPEPFDVVCDHCGGSGNDPKNNNYGCAVCGGGGAVLRMLYTSPQAAHPLTKTQRADVCVKAEAAMHRDPNLSWRDALMNETEVAHGITKDNQ